MGRWWLLIAGVTVCAGLWQGQYLAALVAVAWCLAEFVVRRRNSKSVHRFIGGLGSLLTLYGKSDAASHRLLDARIQELVLGGRLSHEQTVWLERLRALVELRSLLFGKNLDDRKNGVRSLFIYSTGAYWKEGGVEMRGLSTAAITDAATHVADLYWRLLDIATNDCGELTLSARTLYQELFNQPFKLTTARSEIEKITDQMQRDGGVGFVILNCIQLARGPIARAIMRKLIENGETIDEELRSALYWCAELFDFSANGEQGFDESVRTLYHLCLVAPDKAEMLEIDSPYFSQFETLNEMAREGFLFKEGFIDSVLGLWEAYDRFHPVFKKIMTRLLGVDNKIYERRDVWKRVWESLREGLDKPYLWIAEGNIAYAQMNYPLANECYGEALRLEPQLGVAIFNRLFATARLNDPIQHEASVNVVLAEDRSAKALYSIADSYLLLGDTVGADVYFKELRRCTGWENKVDYYRSVFCLDHGLNDLAVRFGEMALRSEPENAAVKFHVSQCYSAVGNVEQALKVVNAISAPLEWMHFYRFTLERDAGKISEASRTLYQIPKEYFEEAHLKTAVDFAKSHRNLALLRHLKNHQKNHQK